MAKGDPSGLYTPLPLAGSGVVSVEDLTRQVMNELNFIAEAFSFGLARNVEFLHVEPSRLREGMVCGADGTDWDPGSGKGVYVYYSSAWHKLG